MEDFLMSILSQFYSTSGIKPLSKVVGTLGINGPSAPGSIVMNAPFTVLVGAVTANTLKTILTVSGKGALTWLGALIADGTSRTTRLVIELDGVTIYDSTNTAGTTSGRWCIAHGSVSGDASRCSIEATPLMFDTSLVIKYASSVSETDKASIGYIYYTR